MSGKLIIQGKAWGEFESAKRSKGNIEIGGYRSYGGTHTVRMVDQPQLNENQQIVLEWLKADYIDDDESNPINSIWLLHDYYTSVESLGVVTAYTKLTDREEAQVLQAFASWLEQEVE